MYMLCCVESLNLFQSSLDFLQIFEVAPKLCQSPYSIIVLYQKLLEENSPFLYNFCTFCMCLCYVDIVRRF